MAKNQKTFGAATGLFEKKFETIENKPTSETQKSGLIGTQGKKGHRLPRINMAFTQENHLYIKKISRQAGMSITEYVNILIDKDREGTDEN